MMLAKVKEQDEIMLANVKVPSIPTSAACCNGLQQMRSPLTVFLLKIRHLVAEMRTKPPNFGKRFGSSP